MDNQMLAGRFEVENVLGKGSFGTTYAAVDTVSGERVAVKELDLGHVSDWKSVELFEREAQTLERLDHPKIPDYIDFIPAQQEQAAYLAQELAPGSPLSQLVAAQGPFDAERARKIAVQLLDTLVYLDSCRPPVIHRDIKPGNILADSDDRIYLVDFGSVVDVARQTASPGSTVAGTFGYMAPEQLHGDATTAADLYGLGMTLVHLITATPPEELPKERLRIQFRDAAPQIGDHFARFLEKLTEPAVEDRFQRAPEALDALHSLPKPGSVSANTELIPSDTTPALCSDAPPQFVQAASHPDYQRALRRQPDTPLLLIRSRVDSAALTLLGASVPIGIALAVLSRVLMVRFLILVVIGATAYGLYRSYTSESGSAKQLVEILDTKKTGYPGLPMDVIVRTDDGQRGKIRCHRNATDRLLSPGDMGVAFLEGTTMVDFAHIDI